MAFPEFQSVPITSFTGYHWETGSVSTSSHQLFICMNKIPFSGCFFPLPKECLISFLHCQVWWMPTPAQLPGSALWPSSSQMIHHHLKAEFHQLSLHTHAKSKICCGSSLPSPAILAPIFCPTWAGRSCFSAATFDSQRRSHRHESQILISAAGLQNLSTPSLLLPT